MNTPARPVYDPLHHGHDTTDPQYTVTGYDVIRSTWPDRATLPALEVTAVIHGAGNYLQALTAAKAHRTGPGSYGYTADRYACGCRWIATTLRTTAGRPDPAFHDLAG